MTGAQSAPADTRSRIVDVAARLFKERGYHATGIATILRQAQVNSGSLYHFFPSKEALLLAVLERHRDRLGPAVLSAAEAAGDDPVERILALFASHREALAASDCSGGSLVGNMVLELADHLPRARGLLQLALGESIAAVEGWLSGPGGRRLGEGADGRRIAGFVVATLEGAILQARAAAELQPFDDAVAELRRYLEAALGPAEERRSSA